MPTRTDEPDLCCRAQSRREAIPRDSRARSVAAGLPTICELGSPCPKRLLTPTHSLVDGAASAEVAARTAFQPPRLILFPCSKGSDHPLMAEVKRHHPRADMLGCPYTFRTHPVPVGGVPIRSRLIVSPCIGSARNRTEWNPQIGLCKRVVSASDPASSTTFQRGWRS